MQTVSHCGLQEATLLIGPLSRKESIRAALICQYSNLTVAFNAVIIVGRLPVLKITFY